MDKRREPLIEFKKVVKAFGDRTILDGVDLSIYEGEVTTLIGLSGTGKSVTLKHIIGMLKPDSGQILYRGKAIDQMDKKEWNDYIGKISYMFQSNALFDSMTVLENVVLPLKYTTKLSKKEIEKRAMARIEQTELTEVADKYPSEISGGMQKRAALARALVTDPQIVLFDEPTTGQDPIRKNAILGMVAEYQKKLGFTAVVDQPRDSGCVFHIKPDPGALRPQNRFSGNTRGFRASGPPVPGRTDIQYRKSAARTDRAVFQTAFQGSVSDGPEPQG